MTKRERRRLHRQAMRLAALECRLWAAVKDPETVTYGGLVPMREILHDVHLLAVDMIHQAGYCPELEA